MKLVFVLHAGLFVNSIMLNSMMYVYFKAVGFNHASSRTALLALQGELLEMGLFDLADYSFHFNTHYIGLAVPKRNFFRLVSKVNNSRLFLCSHIGDDLLFTYTISK